MFQRSPSGDLLEGGQPRAEPVLATTALAPIGDGADGQTGGPGDDLAGDDLAALEEGEEVGFEEPGTKHLENHWGACLDTIIAGDADPDAYMIAADMASYLLSCGPTGRRPLLNAGGRLDRNGFQSAIGTRIAGQRLMLLLRRHPLHQLSLARSKLGADVAKVQFGGLDRGKNLFFLFLDVVSYVFAKDFHLGII